MKIPRRTIIGKQTGGKQLTEAEHFFKCELCGVISIYAILALCLSSVAASGGRSSTVATAKSRRRSKMSATASLTLGMIRNPR